MFFFAPLPCEINVVEKGSRCLRVQLLGNRPKMFPGFIGGHCVIPNLELMDENSLNQINKINEFFKKFKNKS